MFASSREGEENEFLKQIVALAHEQRAQVAIDSVASSRLGRFKALIVPRHPQRFDEVATLVAQHGLRVAGMAEAVQAGLGLAGDSAALAQVVAAGLAFAARYRGATSKTLEALRNYL